jgi:hypothetical protein
MDQFDDEFENDDSEEITSAQLIIKLEQVYFEY